MIPLLVRRGQAYSSSEPVSPSRQVFRFVLHLAAVYLIVWSIAPWIAGLVHSQVLPKLQNSGNVSSFQFLFNHIFAFTFLPGFLVGLINAKYQHKVAIFVWTIPLVILLFHLFTVPTTAFQDHWATAFHWYFGGEFLIPEYHSYREMFAQMGPNSDMVRGMDQLHIAGAFYAGIGYSLAALFSRHLWRLLTFRSELTADTPASD